MKFIAVTVFSASAFVTGCQTKTLYFGTNTSVGLDVSGTTQVPSKVSFAYQRTEAAIVPRGKDGAELAVLGRFDSDVEFFGDISIYQLFATGPAARHAAGDQGDSEAKGSKANIATNEALIFATHSVLGLDLSAGSAQLAPQFVLGYKRGEATAIPVRDDDEEARSVYAEISISSADRPREVIAATGAGTAGTVFPTNVGGMRIVQSFATGKAATALSRQTSAQEKFSAAMSLASVPKADANVEAGKAPFARGYLQAKQEKDAAGLDAFESAARGAGFASAQAFFSAPAVTAAQFAKFSAVARTLPASAKYLSAP